MADTTAYVRPSGGREDDSSDESDTQSFEFRADVYPDARDDDDDQIEEEPLLPELQHSIANSNSDLNDRDSTSSGSQAQIPSMHPPRTHSHGAGPLYFAPQELPNAHGGQTWFDFLRDSDADPQLAAPPPPTHVHMPPNLHAPLPPLPPDAQASASNASLPPRPPTHASSSSERSSSDRKRRLTSADSPGRRPSSIRMHSSTQAGSREDPINLETPAQVRRLADFTQSQRAPEMPMRRPSSIRMHSGSGVGSSEDPFVLGSSPAVARPSVPMSPFVRRDSDFAVPRWQPDAEATHCFVCGSHFTFFYRKHHCRKCGRVVCAACSPHRITIPRQYIVHPPRDSLLSDLTGVDDEDQHMTGFGPYGNPALGGGEEVRVCNPCVPDPNYNPPPQHGQIPFPAFSPTGNAPNMHPRTPRYSHRPSHSVNESSRSVSHGHTQPSSRDAFSDPRTNYHNSTSVSDLWPPTHSPPAYEVRARPQPSGYRRSTHSQYHAPPPSASYRTPQAPAPPPAPPRRQIAEEDECPVCGEELPPNGPNGDDTARTQHVSDCIALHSGTPVPTPQPPSIAAAIPPNLEASQTSTSLPSQRTRGMSSAASARTQGNQAGEASASTSTAAGNRMSLSMRGLVPYVATEKDCFDEEGAAAECVICFEEFEAGDRMARLVCWCKFHEACIRQWWDTKGRGACPTHQLH